MEKRSSSKTPPPIWPPSVPEHMNTPWESENPYLSNDMISATLRGTSKLEVGLAYGLQAQVYNALWLIFTLKAGVLPWWCGLALIAANPLFGIYLTFFGLDNLYGNWPVVVP